MAGLPNITGQILHGVTDGYSNVNNGFIGVSLYDANNRAQGKLPFRAENWSFNASRSNPIYGKSNTVTPLSLSAKIVLKY